MTEIPDASHPPDVLEAIWDREQIEALFADLAAGATVTHVQVRTSAAGPPSDAAVSLDEAKQLFDERRALAIQIRYDFQRQQWCDTLMVLPVGVRIVRTRQLPA